MRPISYAYAPTAVDADGICLSQTPGGAGNLVLNGVLVTGGVAVMGSQQHITITSAANLSGINFTFTYQDDSGTSFTRTVAGPNATTIVVGAAAGTPINAKRITNIAVSGAAGGALTVGVDGLGEGFPLVVDYRPGPTNIAIGCIISGTPTYTVQHTFDDPFASGFNGDLATWFDNDLAALVNATANQDGNYAAPPRASRIRVTVAGSVTMRLIQSGI